MKNPNAWNRWLSAPFLLVTLFGAGPVAAAGKGDRLQAAVQSCAMGDAADRVRIKSCTELIDRIRVGDDGGVYKDYLGTALRMRGGTNKDIKD